MRIDLHLGVHKTATIHLQRHWANCSQVAGAAAAFPPLTEVRNQLTPVCAPPSVKSAGPGDGQRRRQKALAWLGDWARRASALVLSDENLLGSPERLFAQRALYASALSRLERLATMLDGHELRIWLSVREYGAFLRSAYCETLRHGPYRPFREAYSHFDLAARGWEHLARDVQQAFPAAKLICWRYESLDELRAPITSALFGIRRAAMPPIDDRRERRSLTDLAVELLDDIYQRVGADDATRVRPSVEQVIAGDALAPFEPWNDAEREQFKAAYEQSLLALQALPDISWLG